MIERQRLEFAAEGFLSSMRRAQVARDEENPVAIKTLKEYSPADQGALLKAVQAAIRAAQPESDAAYRNWLALRPNQ